MWKLSIRKKEEPPAVSELTLNERNYEKYMVYVYAIN